MRCNTLLHCLCVLNMHYNCMLRRKVLLVSSLYYFCSRFHRNFFVNRKDCKCNLGMSCVCVCVCVMLINLFIFQSTAGLRQALVQPSRAQPSSTEPWDSSLPAEKTGTVHASSVITYTQLNCNESNEL